MNYAYADPPYVNQAKKHYGREEIDHKKLIEKLVYYFPDGWALSLSSPSLRLLLPYCPQDIRVSAWVKPFSIFKPGVNPAYSWEPILWRGGRKRTRAELTIRDWCSANVTLKRGLVGAKPEGFVNWLFDLLGIQEGDTITDVFPGTGIIGEISKQRRVSYVPINWSVVPTKVKGKN